jgi:hypothetical protein
MLSMRRPEYQASAFRNCFTGKRQLPFDGSFRCQALCIVALQRLYYGCEVGKLLTVSAKRLTKCVR